MSDHELLNEAFEQSRMYSMLAWSQASMGYAIDAHMRKKGVDCWYYLIEWARELDEGMDLLMGSILK